MKRRRFLLIVLIASCCVFPLQGCTRALRDGVSIGVTDGVSDGLAGLLNAFIASFSGDNA